MSLLIHSPRDPVSLGLVAPRHPECQGKRYGREEGGEEDEDNEKVASAAVQRLELEKSLLPVVAKDIQHLEPIAPCLTNRAGTPAVDFVIRQEKKGE